MREETRREIEKLLWKHYEEGMSINGEQASTELLAVFDHLLSQQRASDRAMLVEEKKDLLTKILAEAHKTDEARHIRHIIKDEFLNLSALQDIVKEK